MFVGNGSGCREWKNQITASLIPCLTILQKKVVVVCGKKAPRFLRLKIEWRTDFRERLLLKLKNSGNVITIFSALDSKYRISCKSNLRLCPFANSTHSSHFRLFEFPYSIYSEMMSINRRVYNTFCLTSSQGLSPSPRFPAWKSARLVREITNDLFPRQ